MKRLKSIILSILKYTLYLVLSLILALVIRLFLCNFYVVPGDSMEPAIQPGDFILANKWTYGARIFTGLKFDRNSDPPMVHVPGFRRIRRNDVIVFNYPYRETWDTIRMNLETIFVKRCIGIPGDSLSIIAGYNHISGLADTVGYIPGQKDMNRYHSTLDSVILRTFPFDAAFHWDAMNFGPFYIPAAGITIALNPRNFKLYHKQLTYETGSTVVMNDSVAYIDNVPTLEYIFRCNWYFVAGDKVVNSQDSRYIGLIPETYIIGRASLVMSSKDRYTGKRRWNRMFKKIK